jgi:hypothetical protein
MIYSTQFERLARVLRQPCGTTSGIPIVVLINSHSNYPVCSPPTVNFLFRHQAHQSDMVVTFAPSQGERYDEDKEYPETTYDPTNRQAALYDGHLPGTSTLGAASPLVVDVRILLC